jgi:hypothetical protein
MKCIDAIEGTVKCILDRMYTLGVEAGLDDSEYVRNVRAVIDSVDDYLKLNPELISDPDLLKKVLYDYSRKLWLTTQATAATVTETCGNGAVTEQEYQTYYFDYLYHQGLYPK